MPYSFVSWQSSIFDVRPGVIGKTRELPGATVRYSRKRSVKMNSRNPVDSFRQDLKYGARQLRLHPSFAVTAVLSLALGIGANTAIFTLVDQILLRLLPVHNPRELVQLRLDDGRVGSQSGDGRHTFSYPLYLTFRDRNAVLTGLTGQVEEPLSLVGED